MQKACQSGCGGEGGGEGGEKRCTGDEPTLVPGKICHIFNPSSFLYLFPYKTNNKVQSRIFPSPKAYNPLKKTKKTTFTDIF